MLKTCQIAVSKPNRNRSPIETACGASEVPESSFEAQQREQFRSPTERVLRPLRILRGAENLPDSSF